MSGSSSLQQLLRSITAHGLPTAEPLWPSAPLTPEEWPRLTAAVSHQRLQGLLLAAVEDGVLPTTEEQHGQAAEAHFASSLGMLLLESATLRTVEILEAAGVTPRILKGPAVAHLDYGDPGLRIFSDIDLIVPPAQFDAAVDALTRADHRRRHPQPRPGFDRRFSKGTSFSTPDGLEVDLHRTFVMGPFGLLLDLRDVWDQGRPFLLGGRSVTALSDDVRFLHACFHAALGSIEPRLVPQRDVAQMLLRGHVAPAAVEDLALRWGAPAVLASALTTSFDTLRLADVPLVARARARPVSPRERRDLGVYSDPDGSYAGKSLAAVRALPRWRDRAAFTYALTFPQASYVEGRYSLSGERWRRGLRAARRLARHP